MQRKPLIYAVITVLFLSIIFGYSLVFGKTGNYNGPVRLEYKSGKNIYTNSISLNKIKLLFRSSVDLSETKIVSKCDTFTKFISKKGSFYLLELKYFTECRDNNIQIVNSQGKELYSGKLNILNENDILSQFIDYSSEDIIKNQNYIIKKIISLKEKNNNGNILNKIKKERTIRELEYLQNFFQQLLQQREKKYLIPVKGYKISTKSSRIPNTGRPYRSKYTDGIHHGWDVGSKLAEPVRALDDGIIVRVINNFQYEDLDQLKLTGDISYDDKINNLNILRGNQIWLKTSKGDVVLYSHLTEIYDNIKEGMVIRKGEYMGTSGITGVPDKNYTNYHLHFTIHKAPYIREKYGKYTYDDYLRWDWYFKGLPLKEVLKHQEEVFE